MPGYLQAYRQQGFISIGVVTRDNDGAPISPDADPLAEFFRIDPATGLAVKDTNIGTLGDITLSLVAGAPFLFQAGLDLSTALFEQYEVTISYSYGGGAGTTIQHLRLVVSSLDQFLYNSRNITVASVGTTYTAPSPTVP